MSAKNIEVIPDALYFPFTIFKTMKLMKDISFHLNCKYVNDIYDIQDTRTWNNTKLHDIKIRTTADKSTSKYQFQLNTSSDVFKVTVNGKYSILNQGDYSVTVKYGCIETTSEVNKFKLTQLYYDKGRQRVLLPSDVKWEVCMVYCPNCFKVYEGDNRCGNCCECPLCGCNLNIMKEKKRGGGVFYHCNNCNWNSTSLKNKIICEKRDELCKMIVEKELKSKRCGGMKKVVKRGEKCFQMKLDKDNKVKVEVKKRKVLTLKDLKKKKKVTIKYEKNTTSVNNLIKNPDPLTKLFAEKTFNYEKILSLNSRLKHPSYHSIIKRELLPIRKKLLSKKIIRSRIDDKILVKPDIEGMDGVSGTQFYPNHNARNYFPTVKVTYFERLSYDKESIVHLKFTNPNPSFMKVVLFQQKETSGALSCVLNLPKNEFKLLGKISYSANETDTELLKKQEDVEKKADKASAEKNYYGKRSENSLIIKIGVTPKIDQVEAREKGLEFAIKAHLDFEISAEKNTPQYLIFVNLGKY